MCIGIERQARRHRPRAEHGISLVELIVFIVIVGIAVAGVVGALSMATRASTDPMIQKQALAIAEAIMEEIQLMPFTFCDPDDSNAATATVAALDSGVTPPAVGCATTVESSGPEALDVPPFGPAETRTGMVRPFDNVNDYNLFSVTGITDLTGAVIQGLENYAWRADVVNQALGTIPASDSLLITVTVDGPPGTNTKVVLDGYRVRYAPNALP
jgi:MSHA pilin protein MshD